MGRPSEYTPRVAAIICERLADGESLRTICRDESLPDRSTVFRWLARQDEEGETTYADFRDQYARAREAQADALFEDIVEIADTPQLGVKTKTNEKGETETTEADMIEHRRLRVDARKWVAARLAPKKYGDKVMAEVTGKDGKDLPSAAPIVVFKLPDNGRNPD